MMVLFPFSILLMEVAEGISGSMEGRGISRFSRIMGVLGTGKEMD
jgi:hypothetical protein